MRGYFNNDVVESGWPAVIQALATPARAQRTDDGDRRFSTRDGAPVWPAAPATVTSKESQSSRVTELRRESFKWLQNFQSKQTAG